MRVAATVIAAACLLTFNQSERPSAGFGFRFEFGECTTDVLDTFQALYTRGMGQEMGHDVPAISVSVTLPPESLDVAFEAIIAARFFDQPSLRRSVHPTVYPESHYRLEVRNNTVAHTVVWSSGSDPSALRATDDLHRLAATLRSLITALPEVKRLPSPHGICL